MTYNQYRGLLDEQTNSGGAYNVYDAAVTNFYQILGEFVVTGLITVCLVAVCIWLLWHIFLCATCAVIVVHGALSALGAQIYSLKQRFGLIPTVIVYSLMPVVLFFIFNWYQSHTFLELLVLTAVGSALTVAVIERRAHQSIKIKR